MAEMLTRDNQGESARDGVFINLVLETDGTTDGSRLVDAATGKRIFAEGCVASQMIMHIDSNGRGKAGIMLDGLPVRWLNQREGG